MDTEQFYMHKKTLTWLNVFWSFIKTIYKSSHWYTEASRPAFSIK